MVPYSKSLTMQSAAVATGNGVVFDVGDLASLVMQVTGTFVGTVTFEATVDQTNWVAVQTINLNDGTVGTTGTAAGLYACVVAGLKQVRARISAYTSGSITVTGFGSSAGSGPTLQTLTYLLASGARAGAGSEAQVFTKGIIAGAVAGTDEHAFVGGVAVSENDATRPAGSFNQAGVARILEAKDSGTATWYAADGGGQVDVPQAGGAAATEGLQCVDNTNSGFNRRRQYIDGMWRNIGGEDGCLNRTFLITWT